MDTAAGLQVIKPWFGVTDIDHRTILLSEPGLHRLIAANIWWIRGRDRDLVIDSGNGIASLRQLLPEIFERDPLLIVTHFHADHGGGAHEFGEVWAHRADAGRIGAPRPGSLLGGRPLAADGSLDGTPLAVLPPLLINGLPHEGYDPGGYAVRPAAVSREVGEGDVIDLGDLKFTVLHLPGHTAGSIGLYDEHAGTLFTGDVIYDGVLLDTGESSDIQAYLQTMRRLTEIPVSIAHGGHKPSFDRARLIEIASDYIARRADGTSRPAR
jgi:glyoxylase-like metal-dependent hydrolase (beta-lactamase superfamily II)